MAKVIAIGEPVTESERRLIAHLRDQLPDSYLVVHNFEIGRDGEVFEVDLALVAPHAVYLVDAKGTRGATLVAEGRWHPEHHGAFLSPLAKLRGHAKAVKSFLVDAHRGRRELEKVYVEAAVVLTAPGATLNDPTGRDGPWVTPIAGAKGFFSDAARVPERFVRNLGASQEAILTALRGRPKPRRGPLRFQDWEVTERLGATDRYAEYAAFNALVGPQSAATLRVYTTDPYADEEARKAHARRITTAYRALVAMPAHGGVPGVRGFFAHDLHQFVLVTERVAGQSLRAHIELPARALTHAQKLRVARELLGALAHLTRHKVVHRNLTPSTLLVGSDGALRVTDFEFARSGDDRAHTIAGEIVDDLDVRYQAPEMFEDPGAASAASDVFAAGAVLYELFTGRRAFGKAEEIFDRAGAFPAPPSTLRPELPAGFDAWLQPLCAFAAADRPTAEAALAGLDALTADVAPPPPPSPPALTTEALQRLTPGTALTHKYVVDRPLGAGRFGVVYAVVDTWADVKFAMKILVRAGALQRERMLAEYRALRALPAHPRIVRLVEADMLPGDGGVPYLLFEYVEGQGLDDMLGQAKRGAERPPDPAGPRRLSPDDALLLARQCLEGLVHLHAHGVWHQDIKPANLMWTQAGVKLIDFNVSANARDRERLGGGTERYVPPDFDWDVTPTDAERVDRDLYALGITVYEALAGPAFPSAGRPPPRTEAADPRKVQGVRDDLAPEFVMALLRAIAPTRPERFHTAAEMLATFAAVPSALRPPAAPPAPPPSVGAPRRRAPAAAPNTNPTVRRLLTVYSQSRSTNAGTRGLDAIAEQTWVATALERTLLPEVALGRHRLVVITGNAGDGKTAFVQRLESMADGGRVERPHPNQGHFTIKGRPFVTNHDGSQDEGPRTNDAVLQDFFGPFRGDAAAGWPAEETRLIAINEGRLVDFFEAHEAAWPRLAATLRRLGGAGGAAEGVAVVNLNLRSVVAEDEPGTSILALTLARLTEAEHWAPCQRCDLRDRCYVHHNALTFRDATAGPRVLERLATLYAVVHLRGRLHVTLRDLRSALAFMLVGTRDCDEVHALYESGDRFAIAQGFYFNSWMGGDGPQRDRLLTELRAVDVADADDPRLDRALDFVSPSDDHRLLRFEGRATYDREVLRRLHAELPRDVSEGPHERRAEAHRWFVGMARRRVYFEGRDPEAWRGMIPYRAAPRLLEIIRGSEAPEALRDELLDAINRAEGLSRPERIGPHVALEVRRVPNGTIRSYRLFARARFSLAIRDPAAGNAWVEHAPTGLVLRHEGGAELAVTLDVFEMLQRLREGYRPSVEELQGRWLSLAVFKNVLGASPYQEVLLTTTGDVFYSVARRDDGRLELSRVAGG